MTDEQLMLIAIEEAKLAESHGDIPIGALVVLEGDIISLSLIHISEPTRPY